jgi:hypothetical protein
MKKIPKTVEVGGKTFKIKIYKKIPKNILAELGMVAGWCDWDDSILGLIEKYARRDNLTLFHEIGHAAADAVKATNTMTNENFARPFFAIFYGALKQIGMIK